MKCRSVCIPVVLALFVGLSACSLLPQRGAEKEREREVTIQQVPAAVKATILREAGGHEVLEVEEITRGDVTTYEAEWIVDDMEIEITVASDGKLLGTETEPADEDDEDEDDDD